MHREKFNSLLCTDSAQLNAHASCNGNFTGKCNQSENKIPEHCREQSRLNEISRFNNGQIFVTNLVAVLKSSSVMVPWATEHHVGNHQ
jgi:hypothetical protein